MEAEPPRESPPPPPQEPPPPPPPAPPAPGEEKASGGMRLAAVVLALVLAFGAAVMIVASIDIGETAPCDDIEAVIESGKDECFDGSSGQKTASLVLTWPGGILAALAALAALAFAIRGTGGQWVLRLTAAAVVLSGLGILIGSV